MQALKPLVLATQAGLPLTPRPYHAIAARLGSNVAAVIAGARACVAVDTGLGHLAAALDVPSISLYGPTLPVKVGAYGRGQVHLCATGPLAGGGDRDKPCFDGLDAARVAPELDRLLASLETR